MAQTDWIGPKVGGHWRCLYSHRVNRVNSRRALTSKYDDSTTSIVQVSLLCYYYYDTPELDEFLVRYGDDPGTVGVVMVTVWVER